MESNSNSTINHEDIIHLMSSTEIMIKSDVINMAMRFLNRLEKWNLR